MPVEKPEIGAELPVQETLLSQQRRFFSYAPLGVRGSHYDDRTSDLFRRDARMDAISRRVGLVATRSSSG